MTSKHPPTPRLAFDKRSQLICFRHLALPHSLLRSLCSSVSFSLACTIPLFKSAPRMDDTPYEPDLSGQDVLLELSQAGITTAYQIQAFCLVDHLHTAFLSSTHLLLSEGIVFL